MRSNIAFSQPHLTPVLLSPKYIFFPSWFLWDFLISIGIQMLWHFSSLYLSRWALTLECISLLSSYLDTRPVQIAARPWKAFCFSAGGPSEPGEDILRGVIAEGSEVVVAGPLTGLWGPWALLWLLFSLPLSIQFPPLSWGSSLVKWRRDIFQMDETHGHRWQFPRSRLPDDTPSNPPPIYHLCDYLRQP